MYQLEGGDGERDLGGCYEPKFRTRLISHSNLKEKSSELNSEEIEKKWRQEQKKRRKQQMLKDLISLFNNIIFYIITCYLY
jgi:transcriptional regulator of NAD metabolism